MCKIKFEIKKPGTVSIRVVDVIGKQVASATNNYDVPGFYEVYFNDEPLMPGRYYFRIYDSAFKDVKDNINKFLIQSGPIIIGNNIPQKTNEFNNLL